MRQICIGFFGLNLLVVIGCHTSTSSQASIQDSVQLVAEVGVVAFDSIIHNRTDAIVLDVRSDEEWARGHLPGASFLSFDWDDRINHLKALPHDRPVLVYCEAGGRSGVITEELRILGHPEIYDLIGGVEGWVAASMPITSGKPVPIND